ncbi:MAG: FkbM family methyltransferase [Lacibacter sp.]
MTITQKVQFHLIKSIKMSWFYVRYSIYPWKRIAGIDIPLRPSMGYSVLRFADKGDYEAGEVEIVSATLQPSDRVLELGTGIGFISAFCSRKIGSGQVFTYEANRFMEPHILRLYKRNNVSPNLTFSILGKQPGITSFYVSKNGFFSSSAMQVDNAEKIEVEVRSLNEEIERIKPTYLIMDIEGGEYDVFSTINFSTVNKVQFELHPEMLGEEKVNKIFSILESAGFQQDVQFTDRNNFFFHRS